MYRAALFTITKRWNEDKDSVTDEWIKKIHTYMYYVYQLWPLWYISQLVVTPWTTAHQASLSSPSPGTCSNSRPLSWWCHPTISSSVVPFSCLQSFPAWGYDESVLPIRWPKDWSFSFSISLFNKYSGLISFRIDWFDLLEIQRTLKSALQHHSSEVSTFWCSVFFIVPLTHPYMTTGKKYSFD